MQRSADPSLHSVLMAAPSVRVRRFLIAKMRGQPNLFYQHHVTINFANVARLAPIAAATRAKTTFATMIESYGLDLSKQPCSMRASCTLMGSLSLFDRSVLPALGGTAIQVQSTKQCFYIGRAFSRPMRGKGLRRSGRLLEMTRWWGSRL